MKMGKRSWPPLMDLFMALSWPLMVYPLFVFIHVLFKYMVMNNLGCICMAKKHCIFMGNTLIYLTCSCFMMAVSWAVVSICVHIARFFWIYNNNLIYHKTLKVEIYPLYCLGSTIKHIKDCSNFFFVKFVCKYVYFITEWDIENVTWWMPYFSFKNIQIMAWTNYKDRRNN